MSAVASPVDWTGFPTRSRWDLHVHTSLSDGLLPPAEVLEKAASLGLSVLALTDHDMAPSLPAGEHQFGEDRIVLLHGAEISVRYQDRGIHLLVYFPGEMPQGFRDFCKQRAVSRADRYDRARESLGLSGIPPASDEARRGEVAVTRAHLARSLVKAGHVDHVGQAFGRYLNIEHGHFQREELEIADVLDLARSLGAVCSWAHPNPEHARALAQPLARLGLAGLEGLRPGLGRSQRNAFRRLAKARGLVLTGGSDWHGWGTAFGTFGMDGQQAAPFARLLARS